MGPRLVGGRGRWVGGQRVAQGVPPGTGHLAIWASGRPAAPYLAPLTRPGLPTPQASRLPPGAPRGPGPGARRAGGSVLQLPPPSGAQLPRPPRPASRSHLGGCGRSCQPGAREGRERTAPLPARLTSAGPGPQAAQRHRWFRARGASGPGLQCQGWNPRLVSPEPPTHWQDPPALSLLSRGLAEQSCLPGAVSGGGRGGGLGTQVSSRPFWDSSSA